MNTNLLAIAAELSDDALVANVKRLAQRSRGVDVELIAHLAVLDARKLHCGQGAGRLFGYCTEILRFSEAVAYNLIKAARAARRFPVILDLLTDGSANLTTVRLLAPHLTEENHRAVLAEATGMTRRQVERLVARLAPQPDVPSSIRKLPTPAARSAAPAAAPGLGPRRKGREGHRSMSESARRVSATKERPNDDAAACRNPAPGRRCPLAGPLPRAGHRGTEAHDDLRCLQDLLRREIPDGDPAAIVARALRLLRMKSRRRSSLQHRGRGRAEARSRAHAHVPAEVERRVWRRDGGQCAFLRRTGAGARNAATSSSTTSNPMPWAVKQPSRTSLYGAGRTTSTRPN